MPRKKEKKEKKTRPRQILGAFDFEFFTVTMILLGFGLVMVFSASMPTALYRSIYEHDKYAVFRNQSMWAAMGLAAMFALSRFDYHKLKKWVNVTFLGSLVLMLLVPFIGVTRNGATRWLGFGSFTIQPSEILKFTLIAFFAKRLSEDDKDKIRDFKEGLLPLLIWLGICAGLCVFQSHLSAMVMMVALGGVMIVAGGANWKHLAPFAVIGAIGVWALIKFEPYRMARFTAFLDPFADPQDSGYQIVQSLYAIGSGGFFGLGLGQSRQKFLYLPEAYNDYIFSVICEELGLLGAIVVLALFAFFIYRGIRIAFHAPDQFGMYLAFGVVAMVGLQVAINVAVDTSWLPSTGMPLPFFTAGGSALVFLLAAVGVLLNISRQGTADKNKSAFAGFLRKGQTSSKGEEA